MIDWQALSKTERKSALARPAISESGLLSQQVENILNNVKQNGDKALYELTEKFEGVLDALIIDRNNDPNSQDTARRLAKMYYKEIMSGRYDARPNATAFPNVTNDPYKGMLVVRSELKSMCSHHHQPVSGVAYIGIIAAALFISK